MEVDIGIIVTLSLARHALKAKAVQHFWNGTALKPWWLGQASSTATWKKCHPSTDMDVNLVTTKVPITLYIDCIFKIFFS